VLQLYSPGGRMRVSAWCASAAWAWESTEEDEGRGVAPAPTTSAGSATASGSESDVDQRGLAWFLRPIADRDWDRWGSKAADAREGDRRPSIPFPISGSINLGDGDWITDGKQATVVGIKRGGPGTEEVSYSRVGRGREALTLIFFPILFLQLFFSQSFFSPIFTTLAAYKSWSSTVFSSY